MKSLTGRMLDIATGRAGLSLQKTLAYRDRFASMGFALPDLEVSTPTKRLRRAAAPTHRRRRSSRRRFWQSLTPSCGYLGKIIASEPCSCGGKAQGDIHLCQLLKTASGSPKKCVTTDKQRLSFVDDNLRQALISCESCPHRAPPRWVTTAQLIADTRALVTSLPEGITDVAGHARSGMLPATIAAMQLHVPLWMIRSHEDHRDVVPAGNGWRLDQGKPRRRGKLLVLDDNCMTGNSLTRLRPVVAEWAETQGFSEAIEATVYANPHAQHLPAIFEQAVPWPSYYEWNFFNSTFSPGFALDFDGILCRDCRPEEDDDGPKYLDFLRAAEPLHLPRRTAIPLIVTARLEKYRAETMAWLDRHGLRVSRLEMLPLAGKAERSYDAIITHKARHFAEFRQGKSNIRFGERMFVESDDHQAREIAGATGGLVICPTSAQVYKRMP